jgi:hypothetical protein
MSEVPLWWIQSDLPNREREGSFRRSTFTRGRSRTRRGSRLLLELPLASDLEHNKAVKSRFWPWLEPFLIKVFRLI